MVHQSTVRDAASLVDKGFAAVGTCIMDFLVHGHWRWWYKVTEQINSERVQYSKAILEVPIDSSRKILSAAFHLEGACHQRIPLLRAALNKLKQVSVVCRALVRDGTQVGNILPDKPMPRRLEWCRDFNQGVKVIRANMNKATKITKPGGRNPKR